MQMQGERRSWAGPFHKLKAARSRSTRVDRTRSTSYKSKLGIIEGGGPVQCNPIKMERIERGEREDEPRPLRSGAGGDSCVVSVDR